MRIPASSSCHHAVKSSQQPERLTSARSISNTSSTRGIVDTSKGQSVTHVGPSKDGYKLSVQTACLRLAVTLKATRFLRHLVKEIEYVWDFSRRRPYATPCPGGGCAVPRQAHRGLGIRHACAQLGTEGLPHQLRSGKHTPFSQPRPPARHEIRWKTDDAKRYVLKSC
jgi:hypothetical protein